MFHILKNDIFTERVTGSTPFHPLVSYLHKRHFHREGYRLHPFSSSCVMKTAFPPRGSPAPSLFILLFHILKNGIFTERVTGSTPFHPLVSYLQKRHFHQGGYRLHPLFILLFHIFKNQFSPRRLPAPPLVILLFHIFKEGIFTERVTGPAPFHPFVPYLQKTTFSPTELPAPPLFTLLFHISKHIQKRHLHREGYRLHPFSSSCFIIKNDIFTERVTGSTPFHPFVSNPKTFKNAIFTERVTGFTPFHPLVSFLQQRHFHREGYRLHPFSSFCFISSKTAFSPRGLPAPPLFILLFHIFKSDTFTERVTGSPPFHPLVSYLHKRHFHREGYRLHPFSSS